MPIQMSHPTYGTRTVRDEQRVAYERTGWEAGAEVVPEPVDGSVDEILAAVGEDPEKARDALLAEQARSKPRKSLVTALVRIAEPDTKEN